MMALLFYTPTPWWHYYSWPLVSLLSSSLSVSLAFASLYIAIASPLLLPPSSLSKQPSKKPGSERASKKPRELAEGTRRRGGDELSEVAAAAMAADLGFEETELRLGLPGGGGGGGGDGEGTRSASGKRGFAETIDLKLKLEPAAAAVVEEEKEVVDAAEEAATAEESPAGKMKRSPSQSSVVTAAAQPDPAEKPRAPKYVVVPTHSPHSSFLASFSPAA